ncbi:PAS domain S-box protein [Streptomyces sp. NPDC058964]|uniref:PAS domain S-box protein n=1 Tax=Streptomyces sp. NPDC058964 TaxID=3346681 RepID=UPI003685AE48
MLPDAPAEPRGDAFAVVDGRGMVTGWSPGAERLLGYTAAQAQGLAWASMEASHGGLAVGHGP